MKLNQRKAITVGPTTDLGLPRACLEIIFMEAKGKIFPNMLSFLDYKEETKTVQFPEPSQMYPC